MERKSLFLLQIVYLESMTIYYRLRKFDHVGLLEYLKFTYHMIFVCLEREAHAVKAQQFRDEHHTPVSFLVIYYVAFLT